MAAAAGAPARSLRWLVPVGPEADRRPLEEAGLPRPRMADCRVPRRLPTGLAGAVPSPPATTSQWPNMVAGLGGAKPTPPAKPGVDSRSLAVVAEGSVVAPTPPRLLSPAPLAGPIVAFRGPVAAVRPATPAPHR